MKEKQIREILKRPYTRVLIPDYEVGGFTGLIQEFPGCIVEGETESETLHILEETAVGWIEASLELGQEIPVANKTGGSS